MVAIHRLAISAFFASSLALTYWVEDTCDRFPGVYEAIEEATLMARRSYERLAIMDAEFEYAFKVIFGTSQVSRNVRTVRGIMGGIGSLTPEPLGRRERSDIRFHCDNGRRWILRKDHELPAHYFQHAATGDPFEDEKWYIPNSKRELKWKIFLDHTNGMLSRAAGGECTGEAAKTSLWGIGGVAGENPGRSAVTLCEPFIAARYPTVQSLGGDVCRLNLDNNAFDSLLSMTLLHEITHTSQFLRLDVDPAYGWLNVITKSEDESIDNAENYAYIGVLAVLELAGCRLSTKTADISSGKLERINYFHTPSGRTVGRDSLYNYGYGAYLAPS